MNNEQEKRRCEYCGKRLKKGGNNYRLNIEIISDFDGHLSLPLDEQRDYQQDIKTILEQIKDKSSSELEDEVYLKIEKIICAECRKVVLKLFMTPEWD